MSAEFLNRYKVSDAIDTHKRGAVVDASKLNDSEFNLFTKEVYEPNFQFNSLGNALKRLKLAALSIIVS